MISLPGCGSNGTSFEDDLTLGAEGTSHPWARQGVPSRGVTVTPWAQLPWWRQGGWGQAGADPGGQPPSAAFPPGGFWWGWDAPRLCALLASSPWLPPGVASVGPVPQTPCLTPCHLSAPFSQLFCCRGATRPWAGEVWGPGGRHRWVGLGAPSLCIPWAASPLLSPVPLPAAGPCRTSTFTWGAAWRPAPSPASPPRPVPGRSWGVCVSLWGGCVSGHPLVPLVPVGLSRGCPPTPQHLRGPGVVAGGRRGDPLQPGLRAERAGGRGPHPRPLLLGSFPRQGHRLPAFPQGPSAAHGDGGPLPDASQ